ncbi:MAG TPA: hypothetical protein VGC41_25950, partial [Kofleriaceae bacterium]
QPAATLSTDAEAHASIGKSVTVVGRAGNAKLGAIVEAGELVVYCRGMEAWPEKLVGTTVTVTGTLVQDHSYEVQPGAMTQGTNGPIWALQTCQAK